MTGETPSELAGEYRRALESQADDGEYEEAKGRLEALRERLERFERDYGDSDPVTQELGETVRSAEEEVDAIEQERRAPEERERELLEGASEFTLDDEWLQPEIVEALNRALTGTAHPTLRVNDVELAEPADAAGLDDIVRYDIIDVVRKLALDRLGETDDLGRVWESIEGTTKEGPFMVVAEADGADPDDVVEALDQDIERGAARNRLKNAVYDLSISPYHREDGTYFLSTAGRYIAAEYAGAGEPDGQEPEGEAPGGDGQTKLGEKTAAAQGGGPDE